MFLYLDHTCGLLSFLPNMLKKFGWNPAKKLRRKLGELIKNKLGDENITFQQVNSKINQPSKIQNVGVWNVFST